MKRAAAPVLLFALTVLASGCGYTTKTSLPEHIRSVHVPSVDNKIDISSEISEKRPFQVYRPGLEVELRNALIDRLVFDGHLRIASDAASDAVLKAQLISFDREPLRYNSNDTIQEFRVRVSASAQLIDKKSGNVLWSTPGISGESEYFLSGPKAASEDAAVQAALQDLVRHIVEDILEVW
jgi:outer membrane lipopolysaccharide assembly protein LptE/RlpB